MLDIPELLQEYLNDDVGVKDAAPSGALVGPADHTQQQEGVISLMAAGTVRPEPDLPLQWLRIQARCLAASLAVSAAIGQAVVGAVHAVTRAAVRQPSDGQIYLVHCMFVNGGPSSHRDSEATWETLLFVEMLVGTEVIE